MRQVSKHPKPNKPPKTVQSRSGDSLVRFGLRLPETVHRQLEAEAREQHRSLHAHLLYIIDFYHEATTGTDALAAVIEQRHNLKSSNE